MVRKWIIGIQPATWQPRSIWRCNYYETFYFRGALSLLKLNVSTSIFYYREQCVKNYSNIDLDKSRDINCVECWPLISNWTTWNSSLRKLTSQKKKAIKLPFAINVPQGFWKDRERPCQHNKSRYVTLHHLCSLHLSLFSPFISHSI